MTAVPTWPKGQLIRDIRRGMADAVIGRGIAEDLSRNSVDAQTRSLMDRCWAVHQAHIAQAFDPATGMPKGQSWGR